MHDALWLAYVATFIKQWGLTSATGFMWALVPEVIAYGELKSGKRNAAIINAIMGLFFKIGFTIGGAIPFGYWPLMALTKPARNKAQARSTESL
jgi:GPH family glycoside/pentoside/hexuronide:cation symporter